MDFHGITMYGDFETNNVKAKDSDGIIFYDDADGISAKVLDGGIFQIPIVDINGGTIDGSTIGLTTPSTIAATIITATTINAFTLGGNLIGGSNVISGTGFDINGGTIDGATIATSNITVGAGKTLNVSLGTLILANDQISGNSVEGGTIAGITITTLTATNINAFTLGGKITGGAQEIEGTNFDINGGFIDNTPVGLASPSSGHFTILAADTDPIDATGVGDRGFNDARYLQLTNNLIDVPNKPLARSNLGVTEYTHPNDGSGNIDIDSGALTGATVISDLDFNVTLNALGHVTGAAGTIATRSMTYSDVGAQPLNIYLTAITGLSRADSNFIVGNGTTWIVESGAIARTSLGLGTISTQNSNAVSITGGSVTGITDLAVADGGTGASTAVTARTNLGFEQSGCRVFLTSNQGSIAADIWTIAQLNNEQYDLGNEWNSSTYRFTAANTGKYIVTFIGELSHSGVQRSVTTTSTSFPANIAYSGAAIFKNNVEYHMTEDHFSLASFYYMSVSTVMNLTAGDYIDIRYSHTETGYTQTARYVDPVYSTVTNCVSVHRIF